MAKQAQQRRPRRKAGRPKGSGLYGAGMVRFAASQEILDGIEAFRVAERLPNLSEAARKAVERGLAAANAGEV